MKKNLFKLLILSMFLIANVSSCTKQGETGPQGEQGIQGETGPQGEQGPQGPQGETGNGIESIELTNSSGNVDTYTITFTNGTTTSFTVTNGQDGQQGIQGIQGNPGKDGTTPTIEIIDGYWYINGENTNIKTTVSNNKWSGKSVVFVGDSITNGVNTTKCYYEYLENNLQLDEITVMGVSGSCISSKSDYGSSNQPLSSRYSNIPSSDLIMIFMGTNDYGHETPLGTINDETDISFYGALNYVTKNLINKYPTSTLVYVTPLHRYNFGTSKILNEKFTYDYLPNGRGHTLKDYRDAIIETCERWSVPVIDLYAESGINPSISSIKNLYMPDGIHPNEKGHERIAQIIENKLDDIFVGEAYETIKLEGSMQYGNKFVSSFTDHNRASSIENIYLEVGQKVTLLDNVKYKWALAGTDSISSTTKTHGYYPESAWSSLKEYIVEKDGYYGVLLMTTDGSEFNFESNPESNSIYNYIKIE